MDWDLFFDALHDPDDIPRFERHLKEDIVDINAVYRRDDQFYTALHHAARLGNIPLARVLLKYGANVDVRKWDGQTPLFVAAQNGQNEFVLFLLNNRADATIRDERGQSVQEAAPSEEIRNIFINFEKDKRYALNEVAVKNKLPRDVTEAIGIRAGILPPIVRRNRGGSRLNKKTRRTKRKRGYTKRR